MRYTYTREIPDCIELPRLDLGLVQRPLPQCNANPAAVLSRLVIRSIDLGSELLQGRHEFACVLEPLRVLVAPTLVCGVCEELFGTLK